MVIKGHLLFDFISMEENLGNKKMLELNFELIKENMQIKTFCRSQ